MVFKCIPVLIILIPLQLMALIIIFKWFNELRKEYQRRVENQDLRRRQNDAKEVFKREVERYNTQIKIDEESENHSNQGGF